MSQVSGSQSVDLTATIQYSMCSEGNSLNGDNIRTLPDPIPANSEIIPNQDSVPLSVLNHPIGNKLKTDFAAYGSPTSTVPPSGDGPDAV